MESDVLHVVGPYQERPPAGALPGCPLGFWRRWHVALLAWNAESSVEIAGLGRPIRKRVGLPVGEFSSSRVIRMPGIVGPARTDIRAVSRGRVVAGSGRWGRIDQWLRNLRCKSLELGIRWPTLGSKCTTAVVGKYGRKADTRIKKR